MKNIAVFASGSGSNAENIIRYFADSTELKVPIILSNNKDAFVLKRAANLGVPSFIFNKAQLFETEYSENECVISVLEKYNIDAIVLAGFLLKIPEKILRKYKERIINIHPALLPKHGGKGMYGMHVHEAVIAAKEEISGITIHLVDEQYDHGKILFQASCEVLPCDTPMDLAAKIHILEQEHFPRVIEEYLCERQ